MKASWWEKDEDEAPKVEFQKNNRNHRSTAIVPANIQYRPTQPQCLATELKKKTRFRKCTRKLNIGMCQMYIEKVSSFKARKIETESTVGHPKQYLCYCATSVCRM